MNAETWLPLSDAEYLQRAQKALGAEMVERLARIRALIFDADGVLTSGDLIYGPSGEALKQFHSHDGLGLVMARLAGLKLAVLTGRQSEIVACRANELRFDAIRLGRFDKAVALAEILKEISCPAEAALYMGDDLVDLPALLAVGVPVAVPAAPDEVRQVCCYVTNAAGGRGAVREVVDWVLKSRGLYGAALRRLTQETPGKPRGDGS